MLCRIRAHYDYFWSINYDKCRFSFIKSVIAIYFIWCIICITFICVPAEDRGFYITHQNRMPTGQVVLHTGNFFGYCQCCGVLTVLYYKMVLKCTAHKRSYTAESMEEVLQLMKDEGLPHVLVKPLVTFNNMNALEDGTNTLSQNLRNKLPTNPMRLPGRARTWTTPWSKPQISISITFASKFNLY